MEFGKKVKSLRQAQKITKEAFCGDESELSVRQLTRIETGKSTPTLAKVQFIANRLGVKIGDLTDESFELPTRYKELKYLLLRTQTYTEPSKLSEREQFFDEVLVNFYDELPDEEKLIIDCLQAQIDVALSNQTDFGEGLLEDYFEQVKIKTEYTINDLILINLYFTCGITSDFSPKFYSRETYKHIVSNLVKHAELLPLDYLFLLNNLFLQIIYIATRLKNSEFVEEILKQVEHIMFKTQDFQKLPVLCLVEWKYRLSVLGNLEKATDCYRKARLFAEMTNDKFLDQKLTNEWKKDTGHLN
ncbi:helix-turn-helix domain-containing protein [Streptococcus entericus]|uniref:helix-turn-helix domain-containing protein n=1 Tax=Streptococcus entericus TaxID=155680 RepID=UPI0003728CFF|nr:XRE family transcriptional regulator [Streptococcus entericus]